MAYSLVLLALESCKTTRERSMLPDGFMDTPAGGVAVRKISPVMGWALSEDGIDSVSIYLDRRYMMEAKTGLSRPDVKSLYPQIVGAENSGWEADLKLDGVANGTHTITATVRSRNGSTTAFSSKVSVQ